MADGYGVIFDMDGVLIDSYDAHYASWQEVLGEYGLEMTPEQFAATFGRTGREIIRDLWGDRGFGPEEMEEIVQKKEKAYRKLIEDEFPGMDGAAELIRSLHQAGIAIAVGSSGPPENVELTLNRLGVADCVQTRVTGVDVSEGKPHPQVFQLAASRLGLSPERCAVIEDAPVGIEAANRAGAVSIALLSTGHRRERLANAQVIVESLRELSPARILELIRARKTEP